MAKADLELVKVVVQRNGVDARTTARIIEEINQELQQMVEEEKPPSPKKQFVVLVSDPQGKVKQQELTGWVVQIPEEIDPHTAIDSLVRSAYEFNVTPKGRRHPVKSISEACEFIPAKILKEQNVWVKTKEPIQLVPTTNEIPLERTGKLSKADL